MQADLNNRRYAEGFSAMIQEHLGLLAQGGHATLLGSPCYACKQIRLMDNVGTLDDIIAIGFWECDLRNDAPESWWDYEENRVDPDWLKKHVYKVAATV